MISKKEKKKRQHTKELKSLTNQLSGSNLIWFQSLTREKQFDLLFMWKKHKHENKTKSVQIVYRPVKEPIDPKRPWGLKKIVKKRFLQYPASLKHFIKSCRLKPLFTISRQRVRETAIEILLKNKP